MSDKVEAALGILFNALILFGLGFIATIAGTGATGHVNVEASVIAGMISGGTKALLYLAKVRGIQDEL